MSLLWVLLATLSFNAFSQTTNEPSPSATRKKEFWLASVLREESSPNFLEHIEIQQKELPVFMVPKGESFRPLVRLRIQNKDPQETLFVGGREPKKEQNISIVYAYLTSRVSEIVLESRSLKGTARQEKIYVFAPEASEYKVKSPFNAIFVSLGVGQLSYTQSSFGTFVSQSAVGGISYISPQKNGRWGYLGEAQFSLYTFNSTPIRRNPQFIDGRIGVTMKTSLLKSPKFRTRLFAGLSTSSLMPQGSPFGYSGLFAPNIGLRGEYFAGKDNSYIFEGYLSSYKDFQFFDERGLVLRGSYETTWSEFRRIRYSLQSSSHVFKQKFERLNLQMFMFLVGLTF